MRFTFSVRRRQANAKRKQQTLHHYKGADMSDQILIHNGKVVLTTEEGQKLERAETLLLDMLRHEYLPPLNGTAFPDGIKLYEWREPFLLVVHQTPPHVRQMRWIANDSPERFGP